MPGSLTPPGRPPAREYAGGRVAFRLWYSVGAQDHAIEAQWLACTFPCRRFTAVLTNASARLGADVVRYSFIAVDSHHLLLAGLPAHTKNVFERSCTPGRATAFGTVCSPPEN
jgi:hypothetical protein